MNQEELKQRLIELIEHCSCRYSPPCTGECAECINVDMRDRQIEYIADHLIANGVTIRERGEWIPVTERLPERFTHIIVCDENGMVGEAYHFEGGRFEWLADEEIAFATHWMPLPEPPEAEKGGESDA